MDPLLGAAWIQGGTALASSLFNIGSQSYINNQNIEEQRRAQAQAQRNWLAQQEYNSPQNQVARIQEAGLNPDMLYGQSAGGVAGNAPAPAPVVAPATLNPGMLDPMVMSNVAESITRQHLNKSEKKRIDQLTQGLGFDNIIKELNSIFPSLLVKEINSEDRKGAVESLADSVVAQGIADAWKDNKVQNLTTTIIDRLADRFGTTTSGPGGNVIWELNENGEYFVEALFNTRLYELDIAEFTSQFERGMAQARLNKGQFWANSEIIQQTAANAIAELSAKNANIESEFLDGELTLQTFMKVLLVMLSKAGDSIPGVIGNVTRSKPNYSNERTININNYQPRQNGFRSKYETIR